MQYSFSPKCIKLVGHDLKRKKERTVPYCFLYLNSEGCVQQKQCTGRERDQYSIVHFHGVESGYMHQIQSILDFAHDKPLFLGKVNKCTILKGHGTAEQERNNNLGVGQVGT